MDLEQLNFDDLLKIPEQSLIKENAESVIKTVNGLTQNNAYDLFLNTSGTTWISPIGTSTSPNTLIPTHITPITAWTQSVRLEKPAIISIKCDFKYSNTVESILNTIFFENIQNQTTYNYLYSQMFNKKHYSISTIYTSGTTLCEAGFSENDFGLENKKKVDEMMSNENTSLFYMKDDNKIVMFIACLIRDIGLKNINEIRITNDR